MTDIPKNAEQTLGDDLLWGAEEIGKYIDRSAEQVYYLYRSGKLPLGKYGKELLGSKARIANRIHKITAGSSAA